MSTLVGGSAPVFTAPAAFPGETASDPLKTVSLADYAGRWLVFFWYPNDFTFVCPTEIVSLSNRLDEFIDMEADVLAASVDSVYSHRAWMRTSAEENGIEGVRFPILADTTHRIARDYGVLVEDTGMALRGLFILDPEGIVQYAVVQNMNTGRSVDETLRVLAAIQTGELCGSDWHPGQETLTL